MRPLYETEDDLRNEETTALIIRKKWGVTLEKLPIKNHVDFLAKKDGEAKAFIETKRRACTRYKYKTYMISLDKWVYGLNLERATGVPFFVVIDWEDEVGYLKASEADITVNMGGRTDRGDEQDIEPVVHIPVYQFKTLEKHDE